MAHDAMHLEPEAAGMRDLAGLAWRFRALNSAFALQEIIQDERGRPVDIRFLAVNPAFEKHTGLSAEEVIGRAASEVMLEPEPAWLALLARVASTGQAAEFERRHEALDRFFHVWAFCPAPRRVATILTDITAHKLMEQVIIDNEEIFRQLFRNIPDAVFLIDVDSRRFLRVNAAAIRQYGYTEQEFLAMDPLTLSDEPQASAEALERSTPHVPRRRHRRKDSSVFEAEVKLTAFELDGRRMVVALVHDLASSDAMAEQLARAQKMEALGRLAGGAAHDFNNLLQVITGFGQMLLGDLRHDGAGEMLGEILNAARRGKALAERMLAFSRMDYAPKPATVDVNALVQDFRKVLAGAVGSGVDFRLDLAANLPHAIADPVQVEQVLMNLCINARDAMGEEGELTLTTALDAEKPERPCVKVSVADTGVGMSELIQSRIFEPFFTTKASGEGTGLGLASCQAMIEALGGRMKADSAPGRGTVMSFTLPLADPTTGRTPPRPSERSAPSEPPAPMPVRPVRRILLAEDDSLVRNFMVRVLEHEGISVRALPSGETLLEALQEGDGQADLIIMDIIMPGLGGIETARRLRAFGCELPIIFISGHARESVGAGLPGEVLQKPFGIREMLEAIEKALPKDAVR